jgi:hypothetical protein
MTSITQIEDGKLQVKAMFARWVALVLVDNARTVNDPPGFAF